MSIFAFGGAVMLKVGLASQNSATMFVNGLELMALDCIKQGNHQYWLVPNNSETLGSSCQSHSQ
jgi:hypothetical protein